MHVFVDAGADRRIRRFYWIQFEKYLPAAPDARYDYSTPLNLRQQLWNLPFRTRARFGSTADAPQPGSDAAHVRGLLERAGYIFPSDMMNVRFVHLADDAGDTGTGRKEMLLFYMEDLACEGVAATDLIAGERINDRWAPIERRLLARAKQAFRVAKPQPGR